MKSKAPQLHLEYRFYKLLGSHGKDQYIFLLSVETLVTLKYNLYRFLTFINIIIFV